MPQVIVKKRKVKEATEGLERSRRLAKQVIWYELLTALLAWVQDWVQLEKEKWLQIFCKRHQIGQLGF
ncbi:MAG TPA: hypothetical protein VJR04_13150, partial [Terriglobales bacterium]|nr:hypothetical protein [Terriglobales bacterium]